MPSRFPDAVQRERMRSGAPLIRMFAKAVFLTVV
jgi:hypothetical protein